MPTQNSLPLSDHSGVFARFFARVENTPISPAMYILVFLSVIWVRIIMESHIAGDIRSVAGDLSGGILFIFYEYLHFALLMMLLFCLSALMLKLVIRYSIAHSLKLLLLLLLPFVLTPPLYDTIILSGKQITSYYEFYSLGEMWPNYLNFMSKEPYDGTTPGQRVVIAATLVLVGPFAWWKARDLRLLRAVLAVIILYSIFFFIATLPSWITIIVKGPVMGFTNVNDVAIAQQFFAPLISPPALVAGSIFHVAHIKMIFILIPMLALLVCSMLYVYSRSFFLTLLANIRPVQVLYHLGLLGMGLAVGMMVRGYEIVPSLTNASVIFSLAIAVILAWYSSVIANDLADIRIDQISNTTRPLITQTIHPNSYAVLGGFFAMLSIGVAFLIHPYIGLIMIAYHALTLLYSLPPLRLKKLPFVATLVSAIASFFVVMIGYSAVAPWHTIHDFPAPFGWLIVLSLTLCLPLKDLKDTAGDRSDRVWTLPVLFGETKARLIIGVNIFLSFILSVFLLEERSLFPWALLLGSLSFWILAGRTRKDATVAHVFHPASVPTFIFILVLCYGAVVLSRISL